MRKYLLSCDWGTSSFRLKLVNTQSRSVEGEIVSSNGVGDTFSVWRDRGVQLMPRKEFFKQQLKDQIALLAGKLGTDLGDIPVVLSGMASSSIGMHELPYAQLPFSLRGDNILTYHIEPQEVFHHEIILVSGVQSDHDVMRGEETQLIGLQELIMLPDDGEAIFVLPGTHSKHMYVSNGRLTNFKTFMTGEVFSVMAKHSILKDSVQLNPENGHIGQALDSFRAGVSESGSGYMLNSLFKVRTNQLFDLLDKAENTMYLSGLLIGSEVRYLVGETEKQLVLCSGNALFDLYRIAMDDLGLTERTMTVSTEMVEGAATAAHIRIFENQQFILNKTSYE
jgi:2-dehydro-3-deoxygalactonokinase